ncbi:MAG: hypothetical protein ACD_12C00098G0001 [uncultured bacterium]|nr:MAG: hypothetical protein ACD_12C00098G0001 [uncultured bacterium]
MQIWKKLKNNPQLWQKYFIREKIIHAIREFFLKEKFHEVETPLLIPAVIPESYLEVFETFLMDRKRSKKRMFLTTSPEVSLKKLLVAGIGNCFEITKNFRNTETDSNHHHPEFTILEWYRVGATYKDLMNDCERLFLFIYKKLKRTKLDKYEIECQNHKIDLSPPWERISVKDALLKYAKIDFDDITQTNAIAQNCDKAFPIDKIEKVALRKGYYVGKNNTWEEIFNQIFLNEIEPHLNRLSKPVFLYDYPAPLAALAKLKKEDKRLAERVELYINNLEIGDGCNELTDYKEQKKRFEQEMIKIRKMGKTEVKIDTDFLDVLKKGLPDCAGMAMGLDRLVMLFTNSKSIADVLLFPIT